MNHSFDYICNGSKLEKVRQRSIESEVQTMKRFCMWIKTIVRKIVCRNGLQELVK